MAEDPKSKKPFEEKDVDKANAKAASDGKQSKKTDSKSEPSVSEALSHLYDAVKPKVVRVSKKAYGFASDAISGIMGSKKKMKRLQLMIKVKPITQRALVASVRISQMRPKSQKSL